MEGALYEGDYIFVNKLAYVTATPARHDIVVFHRPGNQNDYVKRVVGLPGDTVEVWYKNVYINGLLLEELPMMKHVDADTLPASRSNRDFMGCVVPPNHIFVMGDNRDDSRDSRFIGCVPDSLLVGKALTVYWSTSPDMPLYNPASWRLNRVFADL
jgi:signal peptidase I